MAVSNRKRTELKIWRSIVFKHLFVGRLKGSSRNDGRLCSYGGVKDYYVHPVQSWWSIAILALAVGKRTGLLVGVRYIYLRKNVEIWWRVKRCYSTFYTEGFNIKSEILDCSLF